MLLSLAMLTSPSLSDFKQIPVSRVQEQFWPKYKEVSK